MYNPQDPVGKVTETMAKLFAVMADEVLQEMGQEKGEAVVKRAVRRFANMRAQKLNSFWCAGIENAGEVGMWAKRKPRTIPRLSVLINFFD